MLRGGTLVGARRLPDADVLRRGRDERGARPRRQGARRAPARRPRRLPRRAAVRAGARRRLLGAERCSRRTGLDRVRPGDDGRGAAREGRSDVRHRGHPRHERRLRGRRGARHDDARADPPPRARRRRLVALARGPRRARAPPALDHRPARRPATSRCRTRTARSGSPSAARSTTTWTSGPSSRRRATATARNTDTETIVHLYEEEGIRCLERLHGMFPFAIWDSRTRELHLARDRLGKKPLYYAQPPGGLVFGSEIKALLAHPALTRGARRGGVLPLPDVRLHARADDDVQGRPQARAGRADDRSRGRLDRGRDLLEPVLRRGRGRGRRRWRSPSSRSGCSRCCASRSAAG